MLSNLTIHTFTNKPWSVRECIENYARTVVGGVGVKPLGDHHTTYRLSAFILIG